MKLNEILLAMLFNISSTLGFICLLSGIAMAIAIVATFICNNDEQLKDVYPSWRTARNYTALLFFFTFPFSQVPSIDQIWKLRIGLLKLELASPENLKSSLDAIERIGAKLECKYLGCKEGKK